WNQPCRFKRSAWKRRHCRQSFSVPSVASMPILCLFQRLNFIAQRSVSRPHKSASRGDREGGGQGGDTGNGDFHGKPHPTFLRFHKKKDGETLARSAEMGHRCRVKLDTDVVNDYFSRDANRGRYHVEVIAGAIEGQELDNTLTLHNGTANWSVSVPEDDVRVGDEIVIQCTVNDDTLSDPFVNVATLRMVEPSKNGIGGRGGRGSRNGRGESGTGGHGSAGNGGTQGNEGPPEPAGLKMPKIVKVKEGDGVWKEHGFDENTACKIMEDAEVEGDVDKSVYTFYVNVTNISLRTDMKHGPGDVSLREAKFIYANVLIGLALIHQNRSLSKPTNGAAADNDEVTVEAKVDLTTRALAPFLIPMIDSLGALTPDEAAGLAQVGDDE
ncbi:MAG TPA: hypothetical protein VFC78_24150, partial [Tepidisphaeraceae bacterium]|nr:hypothetical protein [Tepidisphaeraceae bacterium]